ncbi:MAG: aminotransferase class IV [Phycisphaerae bacterium]|jgi:D-amino acid aminotransferase
MSKVFLSDAIVSADKAKVSVRDAGFLYGMGLFETMRACNGTVFALDEHIERLFKSAEKLFIVHNFSKKFIADAIDKTLEANKLKDARIRLTLTGGEVTEQEQMRPTLLVAATEFEPYPEQYYKKGVMVVLCPYKQNAQDPTCGNKTTSYMSRMLGLNFAHHKRAAEALWFTTDNRLAEGCVSNVFIVKDSALFTPAVNTPVLAGVARKTVMELAKQSTIRCYEKDININELLDADEVFLTNVIMQVLPVVKIEKHDIKDAKVGSITKELKKRFEDCVKKSCGITNED